MEKFPSVPPTPREALKSTMKEKPSFIANERAIALHVPMAEAAEPQPRRVYWFRRRGGRHHHLSVEQTGSNEGVAQHRSASVRVRVSTFKRMLLNHIPTSFQHPALTAAVLMFVCVCQEVKYLPGSLLQQSDFSTTP